MLPVAASPFRTVAGTVAPRGANLGDVVGHLRRVRDPSCAPHHSARGEALRGERRLGGAVRSGWAAPLASVQKFGKSEQAICQILDSVDYVELATVNYHPCLLGLG